MLTISQQKHFLNIYLFPHIYASLIILNNLYVYINKEGLLFIMKLLKKHTYIKSYLMDLVVADYPQNTNRFKVIYLLLSYKNNFRFNIITYTNEVEGLDSIVSIFPCSNWLERESWDMFGVCFFNHPDLRRIFTDYGFYGFALRKDFPLTGFSELQYDFNQKRIISNVISLSQEIRLFNYTSSWLKNSKTLLNKQTFLIQKNSFSSNIKYTNKTSKFNSKNEKFLKKKNFIKDNTIAHQSSSNKKSFFFHNNYFRKKGPGIPKLNLEFFKQKRITYLYYIFNLRKRHLKKKKKFNKSFLRNFKNSYKWTRFFLNQFKFKAKKLKKRNRNPRFNPFFYGLARGFFKSEKKRNKYYKYLYDPAMPLLWLNYKNYSKVSLTFIHKMLGINHLNKEFVFDRSKKKWFTHLLPLRKKTYPILGKHFLYFNDKSSNNKNIKKFYLYFFFLKVRSLFLPFKYMPFLVKTWPNFFFKSFFPKVHYYKRNGLICRKSKRFPINYYMTRRFPSFLISNYRIFSFSITKPYNTSSTYQLRLFLRNYMYYPVWYKSSFIY